MNKYVLGLDVSTSCTGVCVIDKNKGSTNGEHILEISAIEFKKCKTLWEKADVISLRLKSIGERYGVGLVSEFIVALEEPLLGFRPGLSSATTIASLLRFNGIVSYAARNVFNTDPIYISASHARKLCGMKMQKPSVSGKSHKEQVFEHMLKNDLSHINWPVKKSGALVDWSRDATDAYVIARAITLT